MTPLLSYRCHYLKQYQNNHALLYRYNRATSIQRNIYNRASSIQRNIYNRATSIQRNIYNRAASIQRNIYNRATSVQRNIYNRVTSIQRNIYNRATSIQRNICSRATSIQSLITHCLTMHTQVTGTEKIRNKFLILVGFKDKYRQHETIHKVFKQLNNTIYEKSRF